MSQKRKNKRAAFEARQEEKANKVFKYVCAALFVGAIILLGAYMYMLS